jgi:iron complex outermembrane receptor protein
VFENTGYALLAGIEGSLVYNPLPETQMVSTLKYAYGQDDEGSPLPMIAPLRNISSVRHTFNRLWVQAELETASAQNRVSVAAKEKSTGAFSLYHLRVGYQDKVRSFGWQINAGVENIFNAYYREHLDWGSIARPVRNFYLQLSVAF